MMMPSTAWFSRAARIGIDRIIGARRLWSGLSIVSRRLILAGTALLAMMVVGTFLTVWDQRVVTIKASTRNLDRLGLAISEQTARSVQGVDLVLQTLQDQISADHIDTPIDFASKLGTALEYEQLKIQANNLPQASAFSIVNAAGRLVNLSRSWPFTAADVSDRDYYRHFLANDDPNVFVSHPVKNRGDGAWTFYLARRIDGPKGEFLGLLLGAIDLGYFQDFYRALTADSDASVTLSQQDGTVLTEFPSTAVVGGPTAPDWRNAAGHLPGLHHPSIYVSQDGHIVSAHAVADYPMVVTIGVSKWTTLANWRGESLRVVAGAFAAVLCLAIVLLILLLQLQRMERSEKSLVRQNADLEVARREMEEQRWALHASQQRLAEKSDALQSTLDHMDQGLMMVRADRVVAVCNRRAMQMLDLPPEFIESRPLFDAVVAYQQAQNDFVLSESTTPAFVGLANVLDYAHTYERKRPNGQILEIQSVPLEGGGMVRTYTDITLRRQSEEQILYFAHYDDLTKLVNRVVFQERLQKALQMADRNQRSVAVLYLDLDRFKLVNDTRGHAVGDKLLTEVSARLRASVRDIDTVARMGGDEFAIIQPSIDQPASASQLAGRLGDILSMPYMIDGHHCVIGVSIGIALYPDDAQTADELLRNADTALYRAKKDGRGTHRVFETSMDIPQQELFSLEQDLRLALERNQFRLVFQPIADAGSRRILEFEALLRWDHPARGALNPDEFISLAEATELILPIGLWVLETACREAMTWAEDVGLSVNLSPVQFRRDDLVVQLKSVLTRTGLAAERLSLEVTEGLLLERTEHVLSIMGAIRQLGVRFSLDDFGTAHSGLSYLRSFPFDALKIDKSFVQEAVEQPEARAIVEAILAIGNALKLNVIAEGVETEEQLKLLKQMQCQQVQGYLTGRPVSAARAREQSWQWRDDGQDDRPVASSECG
ncbi:MAG: EAL domain-containing protein [Acetobacteraceae bacterium]